MSVHPPLGINLGMWSSGVLGRGVPAPYPAPSGFHWVFVTESGANVTENGAPVVELVAN